MALKDLKGKIRATLRTNKVTKAMEAVSAVKMRKSQDHAFSGRPYATSALRILARVSGSLEGLQHPLAEVRPIERATIILVTSDKGLAGSLNSSILKETDKVIANTKLPKDSISAITLGRKGHDHLFKRGYSIVKSYINISDEVLLTEMEDVTKLAADLFLQKKTDAVYLVYTNFRSTFFQEPVVRQLLPLSVDTVQEIVAGIVPEKGKFADTASDLGDIPSYLVEPGEGEVLDSLLGRLVAIALYHAFLEGKASEHSARMIAMKNASDKSKEVAQDLSRLFNKQRQAVITREVSEIIGGIEAMAN